MKIALIQSNPKLGAVARNAESLKRSLLEAKARGAELVITSELALCGYPPRDLLDSPGIADACLATIQDFLPLTKGLTFLCGAVESNTFPMGAPYWNSTFVLQNGKEIARYHKRLLPNYDVFDDRRYFEPGHDSLVVDVGGRRVGVTICEDIWNEKGFLKRAYLDEAQEWEKGELDLVVNLSASPFHLGKPHRRLELLGRLSSRLKSPVVFCNQVGGNDDLLFDGCSVGLSGEGKILAAGSAFKEEVIVFSLNGPEASASWPTEEAEWLSEALTMGLRDYVTKCGSSKILLGLSGGIDSSVVAVLAQRAFGKEGVLGVSLPSRFNATISHEDAATLADRLQIRFQTIPIDGVFASSEAALSEKLTELRPLTLENLQPRIRMLLLMAIANQEGALLLNTSNKSELATGYSTLYGDSAGAVAPLGDLTKRQVRELARWINRASEVIPKRVIDRAPSAELRFNQKDEDTLPPYEILDALVEKHVVGGCPLSDLSQHFEPKWVERYVAMHRASEYKRFQFAPVLRVSEHAFGSGWRYPIACERD